MSRAVSALLVALMVAACEVQSWPDARLEARGERIIGGAPDPDETGTVLVSHENHAFLCSGTLIAPTLVVTAKHCVMQDVPDAPDSPLSGDGFRVSFGPDQAALTLRTSARMEWIGMPDEVEIQPSVDAGEDVALIWLSSAAPLGSVIHDVKLDYAPHAGDDITIVGYGVSSVATGASGIKLATVDRLRVWDARTGILQTDGRGACVGDSGGPFFFGPTRALVGVTSTAAGSSQQSICDLGVSEASSVRNPRVAKLLSDALSSLGICSPELETCDGRDQDCDGVVDNQCRKIGEGCSGDIDCASGKCVDLGSGAVCLRACDEHFPCPADSRCVLTCGGGYCAPGEAGPGAWLEPCSSDADCSTDWCSASGCTTRCDPALGQCSDDMACGVVGDDSCGECRPLDAVSAPRRLGERCDADGDCASGVCGDDGFGIRRCTEPCPAGGTCALGFVCSAGHCQRGGDFLMGERCLSAEQCETGLCAVYGSEPSQSYCTRFCSTEEGCPEAFACRDELGSLHCVPLGARMGQACTTDESCTTKRCDAELAACTRRCSATDPCPPGFLCAVANAELICLPGPTLGPSENEASPEAGPRGDAGQTEELYQPSNGGCWCRAGPVPRSNAVSGALALLCTLLSLRARRRHRSLRWGWIYVALSAALAQACSEGSSQSDSVPGDARGPLDAGDADVLVDSAGPVLQALDGKACTPPTPESECDTWRQCGCDIGQKCDVEDLETGLARCVTDGTLSPYQACSTLVTRRCASGSTCLHGVCKPFCRDVSECPGERRECIEVRLDTDTGSTPVAGLSVCTAACDPIDPAGTCGPYMTCLFTSSSGPGTDCYEAGSGMGPGGCANGAECAPGYVCVQNRTSSDCWKWCRIGAWSDCASTERCSGLTGAPMIDGVQYGVCI